MNIKNAKQVIKASILSRVPVCLWSSPGSAKSSICNQVADELEIGHLDVRAALTDVGDWNGLPISKLKDGEEVVKFLMSSFLPLDPKWEGILFLDEISAVSKEVMNCLLQLVLDRKIQNHYTLPEKCYIVSAGNPFGYDNPVSELGGALRARFCHVNLSPTHDEWFEYAESKNLRKDVIGFVKEFPKFLFPKSQDFDLSLIEFNPRSYEMMSKFMDALEEIGSLEECRTEVAMGLIGMEAAVQYNQRCKVGYTRINIKKIISKYDEERPNVLSFVEKGSIPEQKQALEELFESKFINEKMKDTEFSNLIRFMCDLSLDVGFIGVKLLDEKQPKLFERFVSAKNDNKSKNNEICNKLYQRFDTALKFTSEEKNNEQK